MSERIYKTWGQRFKLHEDDLSETCYLILNTNQRCSYHKHEHRSNFFFVIEGKLIVKTEWGDVTLGPNEFFTVKAPDMHEFRTMDIPTKIIEIAFLKHDANDIQRETIGGPLKEVCESKTAAYLCPDCHQPEGEFHSNPCVKLFRVSRHFSARL